MGKVRVGSRVVDPNWTAEGGHHAEMVGGGVYTHKAYASFLYQEVACVRVGLCFSHRDQQHSAWQINLRCMNKCIHLGVSADFMDFFIKDF